MVQELALYQKTYDLYLLMHKHIKKFPKAERFLISYEIQKSLSRVIKLTVIANNLVGSRRTDYQNDIESEIHLFLINLRLSKDLGFLSERKYAYAAVQGEELIRILYGWRKG